MFKCDKCDKEFNTQAGLDQHNADKHGMSSHDKKALKRQEQEKQKSDAGRKEKSRKMGKYAVVAVVVVVAIVGAYFLISGSSGTPTNNDNILSTNLYSHNSLALHIHPHLEIEINGQKEIIPTNVGISGSVMRVIHTHDDTGKLHVESPVPHTFKLQDFFTIWGRQFTGDCIFEYCTNSTHEMRVTVNGQPSALFGEIPLKDLDNIKVVYGPRQ